MSRAQAGKHKAISTCRLRRSSGADNFPATCPPSARNACSTAYAAEYSTVLTWNATK